MSEERERGKEAVQPMASAVGGKYEKEGTCCKQTHGAPNPLFFFPRGVFSSRANTTVFSKSK